MGGRTRATAGRRHGGPPPRRASRDAPRAPCGRGDREGPAPRAKAAAAARARAPPQALDPPSAGEGGGAGGLRDQGQGRRAKGRGGEDAAPAPGGEGGQGSPEGTRGGRRRAIPPLPPGDRRRSAAEVASRGSHAPLGAPPSHCSSGPFFPRAHFSLVPRDQRAGTAPARPRRTGEAFAS